MPTIAQVLNRRSDLSTFVVHLTKAGGQRSALENLESIVGSGRIIAKKPMGWARDVSMQLGPKAEASQRVACFSETPLEQIYSMYAEIPGRRANLEAYGVAFTKIVARRLGANPIWYFEMIPPDGPIPTALDSLRNAVARAGDDGFANHPGAAILPYFEGMLTTSTRQKEFWWEREWRHVGDFEFTDEDVAFVLAPFEHHARLRPIVRRPLLDPEWSLERMIASIVGLPESDVTPFSA
jgi:hypothetical protein